MSRNLFACLGLFCLSFLGIHGVSAAAMNLDKKFSNTLKLQSEVATKKQDFSMFLPFMLDWDKAASEALKSKDRKAPSKKIVGTIYDKRLDIGQENSKLRADDKIQDYLKTEEARKRFDEIYAVGRRKGLSSFQLPREKVFELLSQSLVVGRTAKPGPAMDDLKLQGFCFWLISCWWSEGEAQ